MRNNLIKLVSVSHKVVAKNFAILHNTVFEEISFDIIMRKVVPRLISYLFSALRAM